MNQISQLATILFASSDSGDGNAIGYVFFLSGFVFYGIIYMKYRNVDKHHHHEVETESTKLNIAASDNKVGEEKGLKNSRMQGANNTRVDGAGAGALKGLGGVTGQLGNIINKMDNS